MSWQRIKALKDERGEILKAMEVIVKKGEDEKRDLSGDESGQFEQLSLKADAKLKEVQRYETLEGLKFAGSGANPSPFGFEKRDLNGYSVLRAIRAKMLGKPLDGLEKEISDEIATRSGKDAQGFYFPMEVALETRDLNLTTGAGAKPTITDAAQFIDLLRARTVVSQLGARILNGLTGDLSIPKQTAGASAYWVTEGNAPTESNATIGQVALTPKTVGAFTDLSRKFILQSSVSAEQFARQDLAQVLALAIDAAALNGSGTGAEPTGILNNGSVSSVSLGTNGAVPTFAKMVEMETTVAVANADIGNLAYVTTAAARGKLKTTEKASNTGKYIWGEDGAVNGYRAFATNQMPSNLTKGTGTALSSAIFGNFNDLVIAFWSGLDILVDPYTASTSGTVRIVALQDCDIKLRNAESFSKIVDMITV